MLRGALRFEADGLKAIVNNDEVCYFVDFYENDVKLGRINYYGKDGSYAEDAAENYIYGVFEKEDVLKHVEQLEMKL